MKTKTLTIGRNQIKWIPDFIDFLHRLNYLNNSLFQMDARRSSQYNIFVFDVMTVTAAD